MLAWSHLKPQIVEFIAELHFKGWTDTEIADKLNNRVYWVCEAPFAGEVFNYESARFTLHQLCNTFEMLAGSDETFLHALNLNIRTLLNVEYESEVVAQEAQRELRWEHTRVIDRRESA